LQHKTATWKKKGDTAWRALIVRSSRDRFNFGHGGGGRGERKKKKEGRGKGLTMREWVQPHHLYLLPVPVSANKPREKRGRKRKKGEGGVLQPSSKQGKLGKRKPYRFVKTGGGRGGGKKREAIVPSPTEQNHIFRTGGGIAERSALASSPRLSSSQTPAT